MSIGYTSLLALVQPVDGTEVGTWGDDVNNGVSSILDVAIAGTQTLSTDANVTLTITQATSSGTNLTGTSAQYAIILLTGARTAARTVTLPSSSKIYVVINQTTGGYATTFKGAATTGVAVVPGVSTHIAWNGSDFQGISSVVGSLGFVDTNILASYQSSVNSYSQIINQNSYNGSTASADFIVTNNLGTASTYYGDFGMNSSGFTGSGSFNLANGVYLSATSGDLVLGTTTSNAIHFVVNGSTTDALTISSAGAVSLPGGTANGVAYLNGSNVLTTGSALTFDGTNLSLLPSGYSVFGASSAEQMRLTSTGLGIGTSSPGYRLDVNGVTRLGAGTPAILAGVGGAFAAGQGELYTISTNTMGIGTTGAAALRLYTNSTLQATLDSSGQLGLGLTPYPTTGGGYGSGSYGRLQIQQAPSALPTGDSNVPSGYAYGQFNGIAGNASWLLLRGPYSSASATSGILIQDTYYDNSGYGGRYIQANGQSLIFGRMANGTQNSSNGTLSEQMRLDLSGNLLVGLTGSTNTPASGLSINVNGAGTNAMTIGFGHANGTASGATYSTYCYNGTQIGSITQAGTTGVLYNVTSDQRLKTDLGTVTSTDVIANTVIHDFTWKSDGSQARGVFAQEAAKVLPAAVKVGDDGEEVTDQWQVDYSKYVPDIIVELQSLLARVAQLESQLKG